MPQGFTHGTMTDVPDGAMLLSLQKVIALLVMPAGLLWLLLLGGAVLACRRRFWRTGLALFGVALLYAAAGNIYLAGVY